MEETLIPGAHTSKWKHSRSRPSYDDEPSSKKMCQAPADGSNVLQMQIAQELDGHVRILRGHQETIKNLLHQILWSKASDQEKHLEALKKKRGQLQVQVPALKNGIKINALRINRAQEKLTHLQRLSSGKNKPTAVMYSEAKDELFRCKSEYATKMASYLRIAKRMQSQQQIVEVSHVNVDKNKREGELLQQIACEEGQCNKLSEQIQEVGRNYSTSYKLQLSLKSDIERHSQEIKPISNKVLAIQSEINALQGNSFSCFTTDEELTSLTNEIESAVTKKVLKKTPLGPLGEYVSYKKDAWAPAIKNYLSSLMSCYCVDNCSDYSYLLEIFNKVFGSKPKPMIIISDFYDTVHDVSAHAVHAPEGMCSMLDMLSIDNPIVANCLIDKMEVERMLLVPSSTEAHELMNSKVLPLNIKGALTMGGREIYPKNDDPEKEQIPRVNIHERIQMMEEEVDGLEDYKLCLEVEMIHLNEVLKDNCDEVVKLQNERRKLQYTLINKNIVVNELKYSLVDEPMSVAQAEYHEALEELQALSSEKEKIIAECRSCVNAIIEGKQKTAAFREMLYIFSPDKAAVLSEKKKLHKELKSLEAVKKSLSQSLHDLNTELKSVNDNILMQQKITSEAFCRARKGSKYRLISKRTIEELNQTKESLEQVVVTLLKK